MYPQYSVLKKCYIQKKKKIQSSLDVPRYISDSKLFMYKYNIKLFKMPTGCGG